MVVGAVGIEVIGAAALTLAAAGVAWRRTMLARSHRNVAGFALGIGVTVALVAAAISFVAAPEMWAAIYRFFTRLYGGDA